jgi:molecular chaperone DnaJ
MATAQRDYYEILGIPRDADTKTIKKAFRELALRYHPDRNKDPDAVERFREIAEAYAVLSDPKKRAQYEACGFGGVAGFSPEDLLGGINFGDIFGGLGFDFVSDLGGGFFERFFEQRTAHPRGANIEVELVVPLERVLTGGEETVRFTRSKLCPSCHGSRAKPGTKSQPCKSCGGTGRHVKSWKEKGTTFQQITICKACQGSGIVIEEPCPNCGGRGEVEQEDTLTVNIPAGIEEGMALRMPGHGHKGLEAGEPQGDLYIVVHTASDPRFERHGSHLWRIETIPVVEAVLGTRLDIPTLDGRVTVSIPPGTQPGAVLRLRGKGLPEFGTKERGDLHLRVRVQVPEKLSSEERKLYDRLRTLGKKEQG